jgi:hypothetical protein
VALSKPKGVRVVATIAVLLIASFASLLGSTTIAHASVPISGQTVKEDCSDTGSLIDEACVIIAYSWSEDQSGHIWSTSNVTCIREGQTYHISWCGYGVRNNWSLQGGANYCWDNPCDGNGYVRIWTYWGGGTSCQGGCLPHS